MPISSVNLKDFAAQLAVAGSDETQLRASVSRAYYSSFHALLPFVSDLPRSAACPSNVHHITHEEMSCRIGEWKTDSIHLGLAKLTSTKGRVLRALDSSRALRVKADYRLGGDLTLGEAQSQVERARQLLRAVDQIQLVISPEAYTGPDAA